MQVNDTLEESMQIFVQEEYLGAEETAISESWDYLQIDVRTFERIITPASRIYMIL